MENIYWNIAVLLSLLLVLCGQTSSFEEEVVPADFQDDRYFLNTIDGDLSKRPFGRLFGPTWSMSKRPFGRLFGPYTNKRPYRVRSYAEMLPKSKRPFGRMFGPTFTGKRSPMQENQDGVDREIYKRPFGRMFGGNLFGKRSLGAVLGGQTNYDQAVYNQIEESERPMDKRSKRYLWSMSGYKFGQR